MFTDLILLGRFQPLHNEHLRVIENALQQTAHLVIVLGSCNVPESAKNPFTPAERMDMILHSVSKPEAISFVCSNDYPYDWARWENEIIEGVHDAILDELNGGACVRLHGLDETKIGLLCPRKDKETSEYLDLFKCWEHIDVDVQSAMSATQVREAMYNMVELDDMVPVYVAEFIEEYWDGSARAERVVAEANYIANYKKMWASAPFPPMFITVDNVVFHRGKILLIKRGGQPGNGLWALPGGFHEVGQTLLNSSLRELQEETTLYDVGRYMFDTKAFDNPSRSQLGAMVTHAFFFDIPDTIELPLVEGKDDATYAEWVDPSTLDRRFMHDDHFDIINYFLEIE